MGMKDFVKTTGLATILTLGCVGNPNNLEISVGNNSRIEKQNNSAEIILTDKEKRDYTLDYGNEKYELFSSKGLESLLKKLEPEKNYVTMLNDYPLMALWDEEIKTISEYDKDDDRSKVNLLGALLDKFRFKEALSVTEMLDSRISDRKEFGKVKKTLHEIGYGPGMLVSFGNIIDLPIEHYSRLTDKYGDPKIEELGVRLALLNIQKEGRMREKATGRFQFGVPIIVNYSEEGNRDNRENYISEAAEVTRDILNDDKISREDKDKLFPHLVNLYVDRYNYSLDWINPGKETKDELRKYAEEFIKPVFTENEDALLNDRMIAPIGSFTSYYNRAFNGLSFMPEIFERGRTYLELSDVNGINLPDQTVADVKNEMLSRVNKAEDFRRKLETRDGSRVADISKVMDRKYNAMKKNYLKNR